MVYYFIFLPPFSLTHPSFLAGWSMTLTHTDPFAQLCCPACNEMFNSQKVASTHVKATPLTSDNSGVPVHQTITLCDSNVPPLMDKENEEPIVPVTLHPDNDVPPFVDEENMELIEMTHCKMVNWLFTLGFLVQTNTNGSFLVVLR